MCTVDLECRDLCTTSSDCLDDPSLDAGSGGNGGKSPTGKDGGSDDAGTGGAAVVSSGALPVWLAEQYVFHVQQ